MTAPRSPQVSTHKLGRNPFAAKSQPQSSGASKANPKAKDSPSQEDAPVRLIHIVQGVFYWAMGAALERLATQLSRRS